jgi:hypothetical protein
VHKEGAIACLHAGPGVNTLSQVNSTSRSTSSTAGRRPDVGPWLLRSSHCIHDHAALLTAHTSSPIHQEHRIPFAAAATSPPSKMLLAPFERFSDHALEAQYQQSKRERLSHADSEQSGGGRCAQPPSDVADLLRPNLLPRAQCGARRCLCCSGRTTSGGEAVAQRAGCCHLCQRLLTAAAVAPAPPGSLVPHLFPYAAPRLS